MGVYVRRSEVGDAITMKQTEINYGQSAVAPKEAKKYQPFVPGLNPDLPRFIAEHSTPYDPATDRYDVPAFDRDLVVDKAHPPKAIYDMHTYWSKKHWAAIREYIRHYLPEKYYPRGTGLVLDCFSGSGMTGVAAMMENRPCVLIDASPAAAFISHCYTHPVDPDELREAYDRMMTEPYPPELQRKLKSVTGCEIRNLEQELEWLYETRCDRCRGPATTEYVVYSERFQCPNCAAIVALFHCPEMNTPKKGRYCPECLRRANGEASVDFLISTRQQRFGSIPVRVSYLCQRPGCKPKRKYRNSGDRGFATVDQPKTELQGCEIVDLDPRLNRQMMDIAASGAPWGVKWRPNVASFVRVGDLFTKRNLAAVNAILRSLGSHLGDLGLFVLNAELFFLSKMCAAAQTNFQKGNYTFPPHSKELNALKGFNSKFRIMLEGVGFLYRNGEPRTLVSNEPAQNLARLPSESVDYAFTDPPYINPSVQYGELNFPWEAIIGAGSDWLSEEIALNEFRGITWEICEERFRSVITELHRVLKPGRALSLCYHDASERNWFMVQEVLQDAGFVIESVNVLDPKQKAIKQIAGEKVVKSDLVLNCRKRRRGQARANGEVDEAELVSRRVRDIILETLSQTGGQSRDKLWDVVLKRLLSRGQMAEHRFDEILAEVAFRSESGRWFLKEEFESLSQNDIRNEEEAGAALERFARLRYMGVPAEFAAHLALHKPRLAGQDAGDDEVERYIKEHLIDDAAAARKFRLSGRLKGIEFYDCLFFYLTRFLKGRPAGKTPRRNLAEFLEEYLVRFKDGDKWLYRAPDWAEAESLRKSRQTGLGRRIRQYVAFLRGEGEFPKEKMPDAKTLVAWLKHCSAFGLADEGVAIYERGGLMAQLYSLSEDERYDADEYYTNCKRKAAKTRDEEDEEGAAAEDDEGNGEE